MTHDDSHRPLVAFTTLAVAGAGIVAVAGAGLYLRDTTARAAWLGVGLMTAGLAISTLHLGRRDRVHFAMRALGRSRLSNEGALGILAVVAGGAAAAGLAGDASPLLWGAASIVSLAFLGSVGLVYRLGGQLTWGGASAITPITAGLAFGAILLDSLPPPRAVSTLTLVLLAIDAFVAGQRWRQITRVALAAPSNVGPWFDRRHELLAARFLLLDALPCVGLLAWPTPVLALLAAAGLTVDRFGFYALAVQQTTEAEVARVERLAGTNPPPGT